MKRLSLIIVALGAALAAASCATDPVPPPATPEPHARVTPPEPEAPPRLKNRQEPTGWVPPTPVMGEKAPEKDPWAERNDLFIAPTTTPTTKVNLGAVERFALPNGLRVIVVPRKEVPVVDVSLAIQTGHSSDPLGKAGLAQFTASMLHKGTAKRSSDQIAEAIDFVGGDLDAGAEDDGTVVSCHARARDLGLCLDLVSDVTQHPSFPEGEMGEIRDQLNAAVEGARDQPMALAAEHAANLFYGDDDPRGRPMSKASIAAIDRAALVAFHKSWYAPNNAVLAISGDVDAKKLKAELTKNFGAWKKETLPANPSLASPVGGDLKIRVVDKPDATQSTLVAAGPGIAHASPDYFATSLMNYALGGGSFSSRLMKVVRSEGGKTYGARSRFHARRDAGPFEVSTFTRNAETTSTLKLVFDEVSKMRASGPTAEELAAAKGNLIGGYGLHLETAGDVARALLGAELDGLDKDFVAKYLERLNSVTLADTAKAASTHLTPTSLVIVGKAEEIKPMLAKAGFTVTETVSYTDPISAAERKAKADAKAEKQSAVVPAGEADAGKALLAAALAAKGGPALAKITDVKMSGTGTMSMQGQTVNVTFDEYQLPGKSAARQEMKVGAFSVVQIVANGKAFAKAGDKVQELPADAADVLRRGLWRDPNFILLYASQPKAKVRGLAPIADGGSKFDALEVISPDGEATKLLLDPKTHLISRILYSMDGKEVRVEMSDYKPEGGVAFPRKVSQSGEGQKMEISYDKVEVNKGLSPSLFQP